MAQAGTDVARPGAIRRFSIIGKFSAIAATRPAMDGGAPGYDRHDHFGCGCARGLLRLALVQHDYRQIMRTESVIARLHDSAEAVRTCCFTQALVQGMLARLTRALMAARAKHAYLMMRYRAGIACGVVRPLRSSSSSTADRLIHPDSLCEAL